MESTGFKWDYIPKTGQNASPSKFVGTTGYNNKKKKRTIPLKTGRVVILG